MSDHSIWSIQCLSHFLSFYFQSRTILNSIWHGCDELSFAVGFFAYWTKLTRLYTTRLLLAWIREFWWSKGSWNRGWWWTLFSFIICNYRPWIVIQGKHCICNLFCVLETCIRLAHNIHFDVHLMLKFLYCINGMVCPSIVLRSIMLFSVLSTCEPIDVKVTNV